MSMSPPIFSNDPSSTEFNSMMNTNVGRKAKLGDPGSMDHAIAGSVRKAHNAVEDGMAKITRLADDETRSRPEKHAAARTIAERVVETLGHTQNALKFHADQVLEEANAAVKERFAPSTDGLTAMVQFKVSEKIGEWAKQKDGLAIIKREMKSDPDIVTALVYGKHYLMNLAPEVRDGLAEQAYRHYMPNEMATIEKAVSLKLLADKYTGIKRAVTKGWFNGAMAEKAKSRVQI